MTSPRPERDGSAIRVSSYCSGGACVGVALEGDAVVVVDTKTDGALRFTPGAWAAFLAGVKSGEFDPR